MSGGVGALDPWYLENLACPVDGSKLTFRAGHLVSGAGRKYPVIEGIPVLLIPDERQTIPLASWSLDASKAGARDDDLGPLYIETVGISDEQRETLKGIVARGRTKLDPVALMLIAATSGYAYEHLIGDETLADYPIPEISLPDGRGRRLLDIGCSWGRWGVAAARKGYEVVGLDPSLGAVLAARRIARSMGLNNRYVVADARHLPFPTGTFDVVYSYSVLQHFSKDDVRATLAQVGRLLKPGGMAHIQMAAKYGVRSLQHQARRGFREPEGFEVRYWSVPELAGAFTDAVGPTRTSVDCFFGLGWQWSDYACMTPKLKPILLGSEILRRTSRVIAPLKYTADSVFCTAVKPA